MARPKEDIVERFWKYVRKEKNGGCWIWTGSRIPQGYGQFMVDGKNLRVHRFSYRLHVGEIPEGLLVCHKCDNPPCVNPKHLFVGTWSDNAFDMVAKGRRANTNGSRNGQAKITEEIAEEIRRKYSSNKIKGRYLRREYSQHKLGNLYGLSQAVIHKIVKGEYWK